MLLSLIHHCSDRSPERLLLRQFGHVGLGGKQWPKGHTPVIFMSAVMLRSLTSFSITPDHFVRGLSINDTTCPTSLGRSQSRAVEYHPRAPGLHNSLPEILRKTSTLEMPNILGDGGPYLHFEHHKQEPHPFLMQVQLVPSHFKFCCFPARSHHPHQPEHQ